MSHLEIHQILDLVGGSGAADDQRHLQDCEACRHQLEVWRGWVGDLREVESNAVDESEMHQLRVLFRELGPVSGGRNWVARLFRGLQPVAAAAVRGGLSSSLEAYEAGPYEIVLQIRPSNTDGRFDLQGQVTSGGEPAPKGTHLVVTSEQGHVDRTSVDAHGEFRMTAIPEGPCRLVWFGDGETIELDGLTVGEQDGVDCD
jgi:hypothetical protein